jgi:small subunit ribosomal protein S1
MSKQLLNMDELLKDSDIKTLNIGDILEGTILSIKKNEVWIDLGAHGIGVVMRRELGHGQELQEGANISVSVLDPDMEDGQALLSMKRVAKDKGWDEVQRLFESQETIDLTPYDANRGGLLIELEGIRGFLPVSQLAPGHYPRVTGADKDEILQKLNALTREVLKVRVLDVSRKDNKLIVSEKEAMKDVIQSKFAEMKVGDTAKGVITGVIDFGAFVNIDGIEGLIHISEISWDRVDNPKNFLKIGQEVEAKIIAIEKDRLSLSLKQMSQDPWLEQVKDFNKGQLVKGKVTRITPFGAFVQLSPSVEALVHVSEMSDDESIDPEQLFQLNEIKDFKVLDVDTENRKIALSLKDAGASVKTAKKNAKSEDSKLAKKTADKSKE